jgi:hypothetical protein
MGCACGGRTKRERFTVQLPGGLKITKASEAAAKAFAAKHPGAKVIKAAA